MPKIFLLSSILLLDNTAQILPFVHRFRQRPRFYIMMKWQQILHHYTIQNLVIILLKKLTIAVFVKQNRYKFYFEKKYHFFVLVLLRRTSFFDHLLWSIFQSTGYILQFTILDGPLRAAFLTVIPSIAASIEVRL